MASVLDGYLVDPKGLPLGHDADTGSSPGAGASLLALLHDELGAIDSPCCWRHIADVIAGVLVMTGARESHRWFRLGSPVRPLSHESPLAGGSPVDSPRQFRRRRISRPQRAPG